jgi:hypothetical protein
VHSQKLFDGGTILSIFFALESVSFFVIWTSSSPDVLYDELVLLPRFALAKFYGQLIFIEHFAHTILQSHHCEGSHGD